MRLKKGTARMLVWLVLPFVVMSLAACGTLEVGIEATTAVIPTVTNDNAVTPTTSGAAAPPTSDEVSESTEAPAATASVTLQAITPTPEAPFPTGTVTATVMNEGEVLEPGESTATVTGVLPIGPFQPYSSRETPYTLLASYYNAINREAYQEAYEYWRNPQQRLESFAGGFGETAGVIAAVHTPYYLEPAAGNRWVTMPILMLSSQRDASQQTYAGCMVTWRAAEGAAEPPMTMWSLDSSTQLEHIDGTTEVSVLRGTCKEDLFEQRNERFEWRNDPVSLIGAYYDAINRQEYERAYGYWVTPSQSYEEFAAGFAETAEVYAVAGLPFFQGENSNSDVVHVPVLLLATQRDGTEENFVGCFTTQRTGGAEGEQESEWSLQSARLEATGGNTTDVRLLVDACRT